MSQFSQRDIDTMNNLPPSKTNDTYNPQNRSTNSPPEDQEQRRGKPGQPPRLANQTRTESTEELWAKLDELQRKAQQRKTIEEAAKKSSPVPTSSSEPSLRSQQRQASDCRDRSSSSTDNGFDQHDKRHNKQRGGVDPVLFEKLKKLNRGEISVSEINKLPHEPIPEPGPRFNGERTLPQLLTALNALSNGGFTLFHIALLDRNIDVMRRLLADGANPLTFNKKMPSILAFALIIRPEFALELAEALPANAKANVYKEGDTEVCMAVALPEVLYVMLSKGMTDIADANGKTALMHAAELGKLQSVKYLLGQRPQNEKKSDFLDYLDRTDHNYGVTALSIACDKNHVEIVDLLIRHGASLYQPSDQPSLLEFAAKHRNTSLLKLLLENGAAEYEADLTGLLFKAAKHGHVEFVSALVPYANLNHKQQLKILTKWMQHRLPETLAAISPLIPKKSPDVKTMMKSRSFREAPFTDNSPELLVAMLEFFDQRESFHYVLQSYISIFLDDRGATIDPAMGKIILNFATPRFSRLSTDRETVMRLLQLSEKIQDYRLATLIKDGHDSTSFFKKSTIPFSQKWVSDPVMRDFLSDVPNNSSTSKGLWLGKKLVSSIVPAHQDTDIDGANLSNELILALKEKSVSAALDTVFKDHKLSGLVSQTLKHALEGLVTKLYPDPATRSYAVCRLIIGYCFSILSDSSRFSEHKATQLMKSDNHWKSIKRKVDAEINEIEDVGSALIGSFAESLSSKKMLPLVTQLILENLNNANAESELSAHFQSHLGLLDTPARRLAAACVRAGQRWRARSPRSAQNTRRSLSTPAVEAHFKQSVGRELRALKQQSKLPDQLAAGLSVVELDLVPPFQQIVLFQLDLIEQAFDVFQPFPGDTIANFVDRLGQTSATEETSDEERSQDQSSESEDSAYLDSEDSYNPS
jgi:ankyrin repeat protein